jgi:hypothetical protein
MAQSRKKVRVALLVFVAVVVAVFAAVIYSNFHPKRAYEIPGTARIFAEGIESADETIHVKVADWPHTFWEPFFLGDAAWPERYSKTQFYRSKDGSVVAFLAQERHSADPGYVAAYDFKAHEGFEAGNMDGGAPACHQKVLRLFEERGGRESIPIEIPSLNSGLYSN